jgi:hypothetical protein
VSTISQPPAVRRTLAKRALHLTRRAHLYLGLFLFPWAVLYGVTAFLFNHPSAFPDAPTLSFGPATLIGTPLESPPSADEQAAAVVAALNERLRPVVPYALAGAARYTGRDFAFATVNAGGRSFGVLYDPRANAGTIRETTPPPAAPVPRAPFAVGAAPMARPRGAGVPEQGGLKVDGDLAGRLRAAIPVLLERCGLPSVEVTVTSTPDLTFPLAVDGVTWRATCNSVTGTVSGVTGDAPAEAGPSFRRFLLRLHQTHGYPGAFDARWLWALIVDAMAAVMCFWGLSGLVMWWQIRATRLPGLAALLLGGAAAASLGVAMFGLVR